MFRASLSWLRLAAIALALACQVSAGAAVPGRDAAEAQARLVASVAVFCQSGPHAAKPGQAPIHRRVPDHPLCRVLSSHGNFLALLDVAAFLPSPAMGKIGGGTRPPARAPPKRFAAAAFPRGPPLSV